MTPPDRARWQMASGAPLGAVGRRRGWRVVWSAIALIIMALVLGAALAGALGGLIWLIAVGLHHAATA